MRPVLQNNDNKPNRIWILYIVIFVICVVCIGIALYNLKIFQQEKLGVLFGITDTEDDDVYNELKEEFKTTLFTNKLEKLQTEEIDVKKIEDDLDVVVNAYTYTKDEGNSSINATIPYINIKEEKTVEFNKKMKDVYAKQAEKYEKQNSNISVIYTVEYIAYLQNNILSLVVRSESKEGSKVQKTTIETFNYDLINNKEVTIDELLEMKNIAKEKANNKIKNEIKEIQEQNKALLEQGYHIYERNYDSDIYKVENSKQYFLGKDKMLYVIYAYGNNEYTNDMDVIIF